MFEAMVINFILFFCFCMVCVSYFCVGNPSTALNVSSLGLNGMHWNSIFELDSVSVMIILMLLVCFSYAYFYTGHYFLQSTEGENLNILICLFVSVMASLVLTGDLLTTLIFWEYLGVVSFFLILFYLNYLSLRASVVTLVSSRFGDVSLFILIAVCVFTEINSYVAVFLVFFVVFTKSASLPFISWLLEAMRAPTPVSSLVHSSTLVAAGVWFSMRYDMFLMLEDCLPYLILLLLTIFVTGICCFFFTDLKKIVALSTCNNISWCLVYLIFGDLSLSLFQLLSHGVSKCLLFMLVGDVMSGSGGSQSSNCVYSPTLYGNWGIFSLFSVILGLSGVPFIGVFFTKHFLMGTFNTSLNFILSLFVGLCVFLSYFYSFRLCRVVYNPGVSLSSGVFFCFNSGLMVYFWLFINFYLAGLLDEVAYVNHAVSLSLIAFQFVACITTYYFFSSVWLGNWSSGLFGCDNIVETVFDVYHNNFSRYVAVFLFRWDNGVLSMFYGHGSSYLNILKGSLLNISLLVLVLGFCCWMLYII